MFKVLYNLEEKLWMKNGIKRKNGKVSKTMDLRYELFGPSKEKIWNKLVQQRENLEITEGGKVKAHTNGWTITLDTYTFHTQHDQIVCTRMRAPYVNKEKFYFSIYRQGIFHELGKLLGMQDIEIGDSEFDSQFIIKSNDEEKVRALLMNQKIRELLLEQPSIYFEVKDDGGWFKEEYPEGVDELYCIVEELIEDVDRLKQLFDLFTETLNQLCKIGCAYRDRPEVNL